MTMKKRILIEETQQCVKCLYQKPLTDFRFEFKRKNKRHKICNACRNVHRTVTRNANRDEYQEMLQMQNNCCAICGITSEESGKKLVVDHSHETLKVRGLLCRRCNSGLGFFRDNQLFLAMAIEYLVRNETA